MNIRALIILPLLFLYGFIFHLQESRDTGSNLRLAHPLPPGLQEIGLGYLKQLGGEMLFIKASVFYGGVEAGRDPLDYAEPLARHLSGAARLHPSFIDTYFFAQAALPFISEEYARFINTRILPQGLAALPDRLEPPFFIGFNHFYHLKEPVEAAKYLRLASEKPNAPSWLGHLAGTLAAEGGDIEGGLIWLRAMLAAEEDEPTRQRYEHSISQFEKALTIRQAVQTYLESRGHYPRDLSDLVPGILEELPEPDPPFTISWEPPVLRLHR